MSQRRLQIAADIYPNQEKKTEISLSRDAGEDSSRRGNNPLYKLLSYYSSVNCLCPEQIIADHRRLLQLSALCMQQILTEQDDDADEDRDDGARAQAGGRHGPQGGAVPVFIAGTHLDFDD